MEIRLPPRTPALTCASREPTTGAVWVGTEHGALRIDSDLRKIRQVKMSGERIQLAATGPGGVWLAGSTHLLHPLATGSGMRKVSLVESVGPAMENRSLAVTSEAVWLVTIGTRGQVLVRHHLRSGLTQRLDSLPGLERVDAVAGLGPNLWGAGMGGFLELDDRAPLSGAGPVLPRERAVSDGTELLLHSMMGHDWLEASDAGLVGSIGGEFFCKPAGRERVHFPALPGHLELLVTSWLPLPGNRMLVGTNLGCYLLRDGLIFEVVPGVPTVALLSGEPLVCVTTQGLHAVHARDLPATHPVQVDALAVVQEVARAGLSHPSESRRLATARALGRHCRPGDRALLEGLLSDPDPHIRVAGCLGLTRIGAGLSYERLAALLGDDVTEVQVAALMAAQSAGHFPHGPRSVTAGRRRQRSR
jgi:hypothetical protein